MYGIKNIGDYLLVDFQIDFDYAMLKAIIYHETSLEEYPRTNDIWLVGDRRAQLCLGDLESMVQDFRTRCTKPMTRKKTAIVVDRGLTASIMKLWVIESKDRVPFELQVFNTLDEAENWLGIPRSKVA